MKKNILWIGSFEYLDGSPDWEPFVTQPDDYDKAKEFFLKSLKKDQQVETSEIENVIVYPMEKVWGYDVILKKI